MAIIQTAAMAIHFQYSRTLQLNTPQAAAKTTNIILPHPPLVPARKKKSLCPVSPASDRKAARAKSTTSWRPREAAQFSVADIVLFSYMARSALALLLHIRVDRATPLAV